ncbi:hypothetical protein AAFF_G00350130 [Aldrovandia affinis]|uniref:Uncharacterized protein n=1 Tax=Aldrovandia affinis TaxID=143900 RepID=A0AAD7SKE5_9TELE|nr:hypothetical protein AAFF_G00350130 [Aldrovandia affinis]
MLHQTIEEAFKAFESLSPGSMRNPPGFIPFWFAGFALSKAMALSLPLLMAIAAILKYQERASGLRDAALFGPLRKSPPECRDAVCKQSGHVSAPTWRGFSVTLQAHPQR